MNVKLIFITFFNCIILLSCGTRQPIPYRIISTPNPATIELDGTQVCQSTPCEITPDCDLLFVGMRHSIDGFKGNSFRKIDAFPIDVNQKDEYPQNLTKDVCLDRFETKTTTIVFDLKNKTLPIQRGENSVKIKQFKYYGGSFQTEKWENNTNKNLNSTNQSYSLLWGKEIWKYPGILLIGEIKYNKQLPQESNQQEIGISVHLHNETISMFYFSGGIFYKKIENNYANEGLFPFLGFGLLLNQKTIFEFWNVFKGAFAQESDFTYTFGEFNYDFYLSHDITLHSNHEWQEPRATNFGLRIFY